VAISYHPKVGSFMNWLGRSDLTIPLEELSRQEVLEKVAFAFAHKGRLTGDILNRVNQGRQEVEQYSVIACQLLEKRKKCCASG